MKQSDLFKTAHRDGVNSFEEKFVNEIQNSVAVQPIAQQQPEQDVKVMQQHEINALVGGAKQKGYEKGKLEGYQQAKAELMNQEQNNAIPDISSNQQTVASNVFDESKFRQIAQDELSKQREIERANFEAQQRHEAGMRILNELKTKSATAKSKFDDYNNVVKPEFENFSKAPEVLLYANMTDNPGECLYDIAKNPSKIINIVGLHKMGLTQEAFAEMKKLSDSIKLNEMSANQPKPKVPLSQVTPSTVGVGKIDQDLGSNRFRGSY